MIRKIKTVIKTRFKAEFEQDKYGIRFPSTRIQTWQGMVKNIIRIQSRFQLAQF